MSTPAQTDFPFVSLDFPGRTVLMIDEIAERWGVTAQHVIDLIDEGALVATDFAGLGASRRLYRVPIEAYRRFVIERMSGPMRADFLAQLPKPALRTLLNELLGRLGQPELRTVFDELRKTLSAS